MERWQRLESLGRRRPGLQSGLAIVSLPRLLATNVHLKNYMSNNVQTLNFHM